MLSNVVGQERAKSVLTLLGSSYERRGKLPPVALFGGSGLGKTHLITSWAGELGAEMHYVNGTAVKDALMFREFVMDAKKAQNSYHIVFVDECHNLPRKVQENLLSVLEEPFVLCTVATREIGNVKMADGITKFIEKGDVMRESVPDNMSFVFATTDPSRMKDTVLNRLRKVYLEPYTLEDKMKIAMQHLVSQGETADETVQRALAHRSRSIRHLKTDLCETFLDIRNLFGDDKESAIGRMDVMLGIDEDGATDIDRDYMEFVAHNNVVGVDTLAGKLKTDKHDLITRIEPFLLEKGWIMITGRGRRLTLDGRKKVFGEEEDEVAT